SRPVARSHSSEPCTNCEPVTVPPAGAVTVGYGRRADKYDVSESVRTTPGAPRSQVTPASIRNPEPMGRAANTEQLESRGTPSTAISVPPRSQRGPRTGPSVGCGSTNAFTPTNDCVTADAAVDACRSKRTNGSRRTARPWVEASRRRNVAVPVVLVIRSNAP